MYYDLPVGSRKRPASPTVEPVTIKEEPKDDGRYEKNNTQTPSFPIIAGAGQSGKIRGIFYRKILILFHKTPVLCSH